MKIMPTLILLFLSSCSVFNKLNKNANEKLDVQEQAEAVEIEEVYQLKDVKSPENFIKNYLKLKYSLYNSKDLTKIVETSYNLALENPNNQIIQEQAFLLTLAHQDYAKSLNIMNNSEFDLSFSNFFDLAIQIAQQENEKAQKTIEKIMQNKTRLPHIKILNTFFDYQHHHDLAKLESDILAINSSLALDGFKHYYIGRAYEADDQTQKAFDHYSKAFFNYGLRTAEVFSRLVYSAQKLPKNADLNKLTAANSKYGKGIYLVDQIFLDITQLKPVESSLKDIAGQIYHDLGWSIIQTSSNLAGLNFMALADYITPSDKNKYMLALGYINNQWNENGIKSLSFIPKSSDMYLSAQLILANQFLTSNPHKALKIIEQLTQENRLNKSYINTLAGEVYLANEMYSDAIISLSDVLKSSPSAKVYFSRAVAFERTGQFNHAIKDLLKSLEKNPNNPITHNYLGYLLVDLKIDQNLGFKHIQKSITLDPTSAASIDSLGWAYISIKEYKKALPVLEKAYNIKPEDGVIAGHLADAYLHNGRLKEAIIYWKKALELEKNDSREIKRIKKQLEKYNSN